MPTNEPFFVVAFKTSDERPPYFRNSQLTNLMSLSTSELTNITIRQSLNRTPSNEEVKNWELLEKFSNTVLLLY